MKELGIKKGEWVQHIVDETTVEINAEGWYGMIVVYVATKDKDGNINSSDKGWNNLKLVLDAGNTAQKSGLLPSELLRQRDELREALVDMVWQFAYTCSEGYHTGGLSALEGAFGALGLSDPITILDFEAAIKSTEPKKPIEDCGYWETYGYCIPGCGTDSCKRHPLNR